MTRYLSTLRGQTLAAVVGIHAVFIPLLFAGLVFFVKQGFTEQFVNQIRTDARALADRVSPGPNPAELERIFYEASLGGPLMQAELVDDDNTVLRSLTDPVADAQLPEFREDFFFGQHSDQVYFISVPIAGAADNPPHQLRLGYDESPTQEQINTLYVRAGALTLIYLLVTLGFAAYWIYRLNQPLRQLGGASRRIASGEVDEPIDVHTGLAEIRELADDIDDMRHQLLKKTNSMEYLAMHDALTGLPNRSLLMDRVSQALKQAERNDSPVALLLMDLDHFKEINDTLGHAVGDRILCMLPERLVLCLRDSDTLARLGGDEFAFLLPDTEAAGSINVVNRLSDAMRAPFQIQGQHLHLGMSVGIALFPEHARDFNSLLRQVDIAMYAAKAGRRDYYVYSPDIDPHSRDRLTLASELRRDIASGILEVHYQPQVRLQDGSLCAIEALCRWPHPERGYVPTTQFIPLAERLGLTDELARAVIGKALRAYSSHPELDSLALCINLSANNLHDPGLAEYLDDITREFDVAPGSVVLEITEHEHMAEAGEALRQLAALREAGFGLAIDDFGTGHSSFTYLKHLPATEVKVDKSFVADMARDRHDYSLVAAIIALGQKLGLSVVAEGVQDQATLDLLVELQCHRAQGFHIARPMKLDDLLSFVADRQPRKLG